MHMRYFSGKVCKVYDRKNKIESFNENTGKWIV